MSGNYHVRFLEGLGCGDMSKPTRQLISEDENIFMQ